MDKAPELLLLTNPNAFMAAVQNHDAKERIESSHTRRHNDLRSTALWNFQ
jgi:hypothetical protein